MTAWNHLQRFALCAASSMVIAALAAAPVESRAGTAAEQSSSRKGEEGGHVLPAQAEPFGYGLSLVARETAAFNVSDHSGTTPLPRLPFQMLYTTGTNTFDVRRGTVLYVPVLLNDDSPPVIGTFPDVRDRAALLRYAYSAQQFGLQYAIITVDGREVSLGGDYLVGVGVDPLPDGGGTHYMTVAAFLSPLAPGQHTVGISALANGAAVVSWCQIVGFCTTEFSFSIEYTVNVH